MGFIELLVLLRFGTFTFEEKAICGVRAWPAMDGVVCLSIHLGGVTILNNFNGVRMALKSAQETSLRQL